MVKRSLLDVNVLVALAWPSHIHHVEAHSWFREIRRKHFATCPLTQLRFVRLSSNPKFTKEAVSPRTALELLDRITTLSEHVFWPDNLSCKQAMKGAELIVGHQQLTDLYLLGLARNNDGILATFDRSVTSAGTFRESVEFVGMGKA